MSVTCNSHVLFSIAQSIIRIRNESEVDRDSQRCIFNFIRKGGGVEYIEFQQFILATLYIL